MSFELGCGSVEVESSSSPEIPISVLSFDSSASGRGVGENEGDSLRCGISKKTRLPRPALHTVVSNELECGL